MKASNFKYLRELGFTMFALKVFGKKKRVSGR